MLLKLGESPNIHFITKVCGVNTYRPTRTSYLRSGHYFQFSGVISMCKHFIPWSSLSCLLRVLDELIIGLSHFQEDALTLVSWSLYWWEFSTSQKSLVTFV